MILFKYKIALLLNALLGEIAILQHAAWVFENPDITKQLAEARLSQLTKEADNAAD